MWFACSLVCDMHLTLVLMVLIPSAKSFPDTVLFHFYRESLTPVPE